MLKRILIVTLIAFSLTACWETGKGQKIGTIVKLADEGVLIKTHEGQLIRGGINNGSGSFGQAFDFTIENIDTYNVALYAMNNQKEVKISYHTEFATLWRAESPNVFVDKIEIVDNSKPV